MYGVTFHKRLNPYSNLISECITFRHGILIMSCVTTFLFCLVTQCKKKALLVGVSQCLSMSCVLQTVITWMINIPWKTKCLQEFSVLFYFMKTLLQLASTQQFFMYQKLLTFHNSTFCPHSAFLCFIWLSEQTAIIYLYINHWLDFIIEKKCVSCAVRTDESLNTIQVHIRLSRADKRNALSAVL